MLVGNGYWAKLWSKLRLFGLPSMGSHRAGHDWSNLAAEAAATFDRMQNTILSETMPVPSDGTRGKDQNSARKWPQVCQLHAYSPETGSEAFWYRRLPRKENISLHEEQTWLWERDDFSSPGRCGYRQIISCTMKRFLSQWRETCTARSQRTENGRL